MDFILSHMKPSRNPGPIHLHVVGFYDSNCGQANAISHGSFNPTQPHVQEITCTDLMRFHSDRKTGYGGGTAGGGGPNPQGYEPGDCVYFPFREWDDAKIEYCSPIVVDLDAGPFEMSPAEVWFNLTGTGARQYGWTPARSNTVGWLVLDRDYDGMITAGAELFGNFTPLSDGRDGPRAKHGYEALAWFDQPSSGGNGDEWIDARDSVFARLRMWFDSNHDGVSQRGELLTLSESRISALSLRTFTAPRRDRYGNQILLSSEARVVLPNGSEVRRPTYDVLLVVR